MTSSEVVLTVIRYLGRTALVLGGGALLLTAYVLHLAGKSGSVDPVAVAAVAAITTLLGTVIGSLGAILVSTRSFTPDEPGEVLDLAAEDGQALLWFVVGCLATIVLLALAGRLTL